LTGEIPTRQPGFAGELFRSCQELGIHNVLDTCGYVSWKVLESILEHTNLVLFDIKHMDPKIHKKFTGVSNNLILKNVERIVQRRKPMIIRMPLIPGYNDSAENISAVGKFMSKLGLKKIHILLYHELGESKYRRLNMDYKLKRVNRNDSSFVQVVLKLLEPYKLEISIN
jgi:pyruvate formate lyase activating enzyme